MTRLALLAKAGGTVSWDASLFGVFGWGLVFDCGTASWLALPVTLLLALLPADVFARRWAQMAVHLTAFAMLYALLFGAVAEWLFWDEFSCRFNFIAVDYLVYTKEVMGNIRESYPLPEILSGIFLASALAFALLRRTGCLRLWLAAEHAPYRRRWRTGGVLLCSGLVAGFTISSDWLPAFANNYNRELARNGLWSLVAAFRNNELAYEDFYATLPADEAFGRLRQRLVKDGSVLLRPQAPDTLRLVRNPGPELHPNIIQITVESLSAEFVGAWNPESRLTPNLDALARQSLIFTNFYATGTRTDRGMEALCLSLPPTPGRSIIKRPKNEHLFSLGSVLRNKGYDTAFIYGGFGYFDNMNHFFGHNGYKVIDRNTVSGADISFANVWGACDEDLCDWTLREADAAATIGRPFHFFVMTTSNHRPFTYPEGRIDLPPKTSARPGAVKYTDYALGRFMAAAATKPWFKNTIFVIVADHCASSAGRLELPVGKYHIPLLIYAPGGQVAPGRIDTLMSQMDYAPTLLGLLNWTYPSRFFGHDIRRVSPEEGHALIGTYQLVGYLEREVLSVLAPMRRNSFYSFAPATRETRRLAVAPDNHPETTAITFYQTASQVFQHGLYRELSAQEFEQAVMPVQPPLPACRNAER